MKRNKYDNMMMRYLCPVLDKVKISPNERNKMNM
jgi:hypothetical protein